MASRRTIACLLTESSASLHPLAPDALSLLNIGHTLLVHDYSGVSTHRSTKPLIAPALRLVKIDWADEGKRMPVKVSFEMPMESRSKAHGPRSRTMPHGNESASQALRPVWIGKVKP